MNLLLDTNVLLWWLMDNPQLSKKGRDAIRAADRMYLSAASIWEIEIKKARGNLEAPDELAETALSRGARALPITIAHAATAGRLPDFHRDPFDRMLVAQAIVESLTLLTADPVVARYDCRSIRA